MLGVIENIDRMSDVTSVIMCSVIQQILTDHERVLLCFRISSHIVEVIHVSRVGYVFKVKESEVLGIFLSFSLFCLCEKFDSTVNAKKKKEEEKRIRIKTVILQNHDSCHF